MSEKKITYLDAISQAMREEMLRDEAVLLIGDDPDAYAGTFKSNALEEFGSERVLNIPMSEAMIIGSAVGAALMGMRPIAEMRFLDFITSGFDQLIDMATRMHWRAGSPFPLVVRGFSGGSVRPANQEVFSFQMPGIKVVVPATTYDAKGMLKAAVRDDNPVLYLEHKHLYRMPQLREELPLEDYIVPLGKAIIRREGQDMTILTYGAMVHHCLRAAQVLEENDDLEVEVLDLRSLSPLDRDAIIESVKRTNKVLIVHEDILTEGIGAGLAALVSKDLFEYLNGPIAQVATSPLPFPSMPPAKAPYVPNAEKILSAARVLAAY
ncbi:MAG: alpha-ketoacid dehydrogenase subunit beta [Ktedonobacteraceae bacterium]|nr:alpha-ketoacid dehydrogenase subunit beta [Ktedonobacteraceae bacterium]